MRRLIAGAAAGLGLLLAAPTALAQDSVPSSWAGTRLTTPTTSSDHSFAITATIVRRVQENLGERLRVDTHFTTPSGLPDGCPAPGTVLYPMNIGAPDGNSRDVSVNVNVRCNGTYPFQVVATLNRGPLFPTEQAILNGSITVAAAPPKVGKVTATLDGTGVRLDWPALTGVPDLEGYRVDRKDGSEWVMLATIPKGTTSFTDTSPPPEGGEVTYRVLARRDQLVSEDGSLVTVTLPIGTTTSSSVPGEGGGDPATTTTVAGGGSGDGSGSGSEGSSTPRRSPRGRTGVGTRAPRLGTPTQSNSGLLISPDEGFEEEIDYGDAALPGDEAEDDLSLFYEDDTGRGLVVPIGIGAVLMGWGLHLFFLARAARPARVQVPVDAGYSLDPAYETTYETYDAYDDFGQEPYNTSYAYEASEAWDTPLRDDTYGTGSRSSGSYGSTGYDAPSSYDRW